ncbi:MAG: hypothetical protein OSJ43_16330 [Oscillospiraceae bacterium]|nr:hypothetical protein [Oscillospiraceae bacterium]
MSEKETKQRLIITNILFWLGLLVLFGAIGHLDYLNDQHITYGIEELWISLGKGVAGLLLMIVGMFVGRNLEFDDGGSDNENTDSMRGKPDGMQGNARARSRSIQRGYSRAVGRSPRMAYSRRRSADNQRQLRVHDDGRHCSRDRR